MPMDKRGEITMAITTLLEDERVLNPDGSDAHRVVLLVNQDVGDSVEITGANVPGLNSDDVIAAGSTLITPSANYVAFEDGVFSKKSGGGSGSGGGSADNRFVVTCTPTAADFSGTMDKTVAEIFAAWNDGKEIYFSITGYAACPVTAISDDGVFLAYGVMLGNPGKFIVLVTDYTGTNYATHIYQLTPFGS
jgi:hypothetical protein